jgi:hypothetical protein
MRSPILVVLLAASCRDSKPASRTPEPHAHDPGSAALAGGLPPGNVVQTEMRMLTAILEQSLRQIGAGDVRGLDAKLHELHAAKEATTVAVRSGAYKLPANSDDIAAFEAADEAFHAHLGSLVRASRANDVPAAAEAIANLVRGCHGCHAVFRPQGLTP